MGVGQTGGTGHFFTGVLDVTPPELPPLPGLATATGGQGLTHITLTGVVELEDVAGGQGAGQIDAMLGAALLDPELLPAIGFPIGTHFGIGHPVGTPLPPALLAIIGQTIGRQLLLGTGFNVGVTLGSGLGGSVGFIVGVGHAFGVGTPEGVTPGVGRGRLDSRGSGCTLGLTATGGNALPPGLPPASGTDRSLGSL